MSTVAEPAAAASASPALELSGLCAGYGRTQVLRGVSLTVPAGAVVALVGANGAGKTTLLRAVAGTLRPTAGSIALDGVDVTGESPTQRHHRGMVTVPEGRGVFRSLSVRENLRLQVPRGGERVALERAVEAFPSLGRRLAGVAGTLSGGEQQMLAMAQAYVTQPRLVLVDEASLGLAPLVVDEIYAFLGRVAAQGTSLLVVDQFVTRVLSLASAAVVLRRGEVVFTGNPADLLAGGVVQDYLGAH